MLFQRVTFADYLSKKEYDTKKTSRYLERSPSLLAENKASPLVCKMSDSNHS